MTLRPITPIRTDAEMTLLRAAKMILAAYYIGDINIGLKNYEAKDRATAAFHDLRLAVQKAQGMADWEEEAARDDKEHGR